MSTVTDKNGTKVSDRDFDQDLSELSSRSGNGIDVALLWRRYDNTVTVVVVDSRNGDAFLLNVHESDNALDMYHHPYAYAAQRRIDHGWPKPGQDLGIAA